MTLKKRYLRVTHLLFIALLLIQLLPDKSTKEVFTGSLIAFAIGVEVVFLALSSLIKKEQSLTLLADIAGFIFVILGIWSLATAKFNILNAYYNAKMRGLDYDLNEKVYNMLPSITLQDVLNFEKENMTNKTYKYIILGDEKELDMKALEKIGPVHRLTTEQIFGY